VASLAGEADGGWWFVCMACDHLWDQRWTHSNRLHDEEASVQIATRSGHGVHAPSFWRRLALRIGASEA
jgi:hypothetical protein